MSVGDRRFSIRWRRHRGHVAVAGAGSRMMLLLFGSGEVAVSGLCGGGTCATGWYVDLLKAALVLSPLAALLLTCCCFFFRTGMAGGLFRAQVLACSVVVVGWVVALQELRHLQEIAALEHVV